MKALFNALWHAKNAEEVSRIIEKSSVLSKEGNWLPYGGTKENLALVSAQTTHPVRAINEKIMNAIDALLERKCLEHGIDPKSDDAPDTLREALLLFYGVFMDSEEASPFLNALAKEVSLIASGDEASPTLTVYDRGAGQLPEDFERTFVSLMEGNKADTKFAQGVFNMGSTAVLNFCGGERYQLIASKSPKNENQDLAFTLVRRHTLKEDDRKRNTWYEYVTIDGAIPTFCAEDFDLSLYEGVSFTEGTLVKMYSYGLESRVAGDITKGLKSELNQLLYQAPLPVSLIETRFTKKRPRKGIAHGNHTLLKTKKEELDYNQSFVLQVAPFGHIPIDVYVFKSDVPRSHYIGERSVLFTMNGQTQGELGRGFVSQKLGFKLLRDSMLIHVNCSDLSYTDDIFSSSRGNIRESVHYHALIAKLSQALMEDEALLALESARRHKLSHSSTSTSKALLQQVMGSIQMKKEMAALLKQAGLKLSFQNVSDKRTLTDGVSKQFVKTAVSLGGKVTKSLALGSKTSVSLVKTEQAKTADDVVVSLVSHKRQTSASSSKKRVEHYFDIKKEIKREAVSVTLKTTEELCVGDEVLLRISIKNCQEDALVEIKLTAPIQKREPKNEGTLHLPELLRVTKETGEGDASWEDYGFNEEDVIALTLTEHGDGLASIAINMGATLLTEKFHRQLSIEQIESIKNHYLCNLYTHALFLYYQLLLTDDTKEHDETVSTMMRGHYGHFVAHYNANHNDNEDSHIA